MKLVENGKTQNGLTNGNKPKIAILHYSGPPIISGVELIIRDQARMLREFNYKVSLVLGTGKQFRKDIPVQIIKRMDSTNKYVLEVRNELKQATVSSKFRNLEKTLYNKLKLYFIANDIDVCIVHNILTRHYNLALTSALIKLSNDLPHIKFIAWVHDLTFSDSTYFNLNPELAKNYPWKYLITPQENWYYVCISEFRKKELVNTFGFKPKHITVIPNGVDVGKFLNLSPQIRKFYTDIDGLNVDYIACTPVRVVKRKNLELGIHITNEMVKKGLNFKLVITGNLDHHQLDNRKYYDDLKALIKTLNLENNVFFLAEYLQKINYRNKNQSIRVAELYQISDFLLMTSTIEGFGLPLLEAGLMHTPIFTSDIPPFHEIGKTNINYFSLKDNPSNIADMILSVLQTLPQAYFYRKVIKKYSLRSLFSEHIIPLINSTQKA